MEKNKIIYLSEPSEVSMSQDWYDITDKDHFWMIWRFNIIKKYLSDFPANKKINILEIGCGNGINMQLFELQLNLKIDGCDLNKKALKKTPEIKGNQYIYNILECKPSMLEKYDVILLLDVIEHINKDHEFISNALKHLRNDGIILINVPAHNYLYGKYDIDMGHVRRYGKKQLRALLKNNNVSIEHIQYWGFFLMPVLFIRKFVLLFVNGKSTSIGFKPLHSIINKFFLILMKFELWLFNKPPTGTSLFVAGSKAS